MKIVTGSVCVLLLCCCFALPQRGHHDPTPEDRNPNPDRQLATPQVDPAQLRHDAAELAQLASTVPADVERASNGVLVKDLKDRLKRIEKLSKRLRSELAVE
jgi:hypothetical protein